jgi:hypothetical protein
MDKYESSEVLSLTLENEVIYLLLLLLLLLFGCSKFIPGIEESPIYFSINPSFSSYENW